MKRFFKRFFAILLILVWPCLMEAKRNTAVDRVGFFVNEVSLGGGFYGDGYELRPIVSASYLFGRHFNENWFAGISAMCGYTSYYAGYMYYGDRVYDDTFTLRILLNGRYHFRARKMSPFIGLDLGPAYLPSIQKTMSPYAGCQLGARWILNTHNVIGFHIEPGISVKGYKEILFKLTFEFL